MQRTTPTCPSFDKHTHSHTLTRRTLHFVIQRVHRSSQLPLQFPILCSSSALLMLCQCQAKSVASPEHKRPPSTLDDLPSLEHALPLMWLYCGCLLSFSLSLMHIQIFPRHPHKMPSQQTAFSASLSLSENAQ